MSSDTMAFGMPLTKKLPPILNVQASAKIVKSETVGQLTAIWYGAPSTVSGYDVCAFASEGCRIACLNTAGRGVFDMGQAARIRKTKMFFEDRPGFMTQVIKDIEALIRKAKREKQAKEIAAARKREHEERMAVLKKWSIILAQLVGIATAAVTIGYLVWANRCVEAVCR